MKKIILTIMLIGIFSVIFAENEAIFISNNDNFQLYRSNKLIYASNNDLSKKVISSENNLNSKIKNSFFINLSPAVLPGIAIGYGYTNFDKRINSWKEHIACFQINSLGLGTSLGPSLLTNYFKNSEKKGFFYSTNAGVDYVVTLFPNIGGNNVGRDEYIFPNLSLGYGYSWKTGKDSSFRISLDVGFKFIISNLNFSYVF